MKRLIAVIIFMFMVVSQSHGLSPGLIGVEESDGDPSGHVWKIKVDNNALSITDSIATLDLSGAAGGSAITLDIEDDGGND